MATAADVPNKYDVVVNGKGYIFADISASPWLHQPDYGYTPTFVERQNVQGAFGDNFQDFWLTAAQNDWSGGEDQKFFRTDEDRRRRYYTGTAVDVRAEGQVTMREAVKAITAAAAPQVAFSSGAFLWYATSTNLYSIDSAGTVTDRGAHGLGAAPSSPTGITSDGPNIYLTSTAAGTVGVRRYSISGATYSTFSATASNALAFLNNTLYGFQTNGVFRRYDTAGAVTTLYTFTSATGGTTGDTTNVRLLPLASKLLIYRGFNANGTAEGRAELYIYDGVGVTLLHSFEQNFYAEDVAVSQGIIAVSGTLQSTSGGGGRGVVMFFAGGTPGVLWKAVVSGGSAKGLAAYDGGFVWLDTQAAQYAYYNLETGGLHRIGAYGSAPPTNITGGVYAFLGFRSDSTAIDLFPDTVRPSTSTVTSSLFDFDSSLDKLFRGVKVDFDSATDGNGGSVDIAYRVGGVVGTYTTLQTGAVSGTEYTLSGVSGRSISVKITLNKGTSTNGPTLKRVGVRAVPRLFTFQRGTLVIQASGRDGNVPMRLRNGDLEDRDGLQIAIDLRTVATSATPVAMTTEFGTISNIVFENDGFEIKRVRPNEFLVVAPWREV